MTATTSRAGTDAAYALEAVIGRLLVAGTWLAMVLIAIGVVLMLTSGVDPLPRDPAPIPPFDLATIPADLVALRPEGFLWAGIVLVIGLPIGRVAVAGAGFIAARDWRLVLISALVLGVVLISIVAAAELGA